MATALLAVVDIYVLDFMINIGNAHTVFMVLWRDVGLIFSRSSVNQPCFGCRYAAGGEAAIGFSMG